MKTYIETYNQAVFQLADTIYLLKVEKGWKVALELSGLDHHKFKWFLTIGSYVNRTHHIAPEFYVEVAGLDPLKAKKYLDLAVKDNLTPCKLRKVIRQNELTIKTKVKKKVEVNKFGKYYNLIQIQLKGMSQQEKTRAVNLLKSL
jgi:hypothetical protein